MDKISLEKAVARNVKDLIIDAPPASLSATFLDFSRLIQPREGQLIGRNLYIYSGAGAGQDRIVTSFDPANNRLSFDQAFGSIPSTNSNCVLFNQYEKVDYDNAVDRLMGRAQLFYYQEAVATLALSATQYEYAVPSGFKFIERLHIVPSGHTDYGADGESQRLFEIPWHKWLIGGNAGGTRLIVFDPRKIDLYWLNNESIKVTGQRRVDALGTDNATVPEDLEEYVIEGATMLLYRQKIDSEEEFNRKFKYSQITFSALEEQIRSHIYGREVG